MNYLRNTANFKSLWLTVALSLCATGCPKSAEKTKPDPAPKAEPAKKPEKAKPKALTKPPAKIPKVDSSSLLGGEHGLDHIGVAVKDLKAATKTYHDKLGFDTPKEGKLPNGLLNVNYYFADSSYLETVTPYDKKKAAWLDFFLNKFGEGANFFVLSVASAKATAAFLAKRGIKANSKGGSIEVKGHKGKSSWLTLFLKDSPLPGKPMFFIQYPAVKRAWARKKMKDPKVQERFFSHRNKVVGMSAVWHAVKDLDAAVKAYESIGLKAKQEVKSAQLQAKGRVVVAGETEIILWAATGPKGPVAEFLKRRPPGVLGISFKTKDLAAAAKLIGGNIKEKLALYDGHFGKSFLVAPKHTHGVWLEFYGPAKATKAKAKKE